MKFPEDHLGRTYVILDRYTGDVLQFDNTRAMPVALNYARMWNQEIHTGDIFGWPTRILASIFSAWLLPQWLLRDLGFGGIENAQKGRGLRLVGEKSRCTQDPP